MLILDILRAVASVHRAKRPRKSIKRPRRHSRAKLIIAVIALAPPCATIAQTQFDVLSLNNGNDNQCQDYVIGDIATGQEIAAMLRDAANGAERYGCVNLIVDHSA